MTPELVAVLALNALLFGMMFKIMVDVASLRERMARLEGLFEGFTGRQPPTEPAK